MVGSLLFEKKFLYEVFWNFWLFDDLLLGLPCFWLMTGNVLALPMSIIITIIGRFYSSSIILLQKVSNCLGTSDSIVLHASTEMVFQWQMMKVHHILHPHQICWNWQKMSRKVLFILSKAGKSLWSSKFLIFRWRYKVWTNAKE